MKKTIYLLFIIIIPLHLFISCKDTTKWQIKQILLKNKSIEVAYLKSYNSKAFFILINKDATQFIPGMKIAYPALIVPQSEPFYFYRFDSEVLKKAEENANLSPQNISDYDRDDLIYKECAKPLFDLKPNINWPRAFQLACFEVVNKNWQKCTYLAGHYNKIDSFGNFYDKVNGDGEWQMIGPVRSLTSDEEKAFSFIFEGPKLLIPLPIYVGQSQYIDKLSLTFLKKDGLENVLKFNDVQEFAPRFDFPYPDSKLIGKWIEDNEDIRQNDSHNYKLYCPKNLDFALELRKYKKDDFRDYRDNNFYQLILYGEERGGRINYFDPSYPFDTWKNEVNFTKNLKEFKSVEREELLTFLGTKYHNQAVGGSLLQLILIFKDGHEDKLNWRFLWPPYDDFVPYQKEYGEPFSRMHIRINMMDLDSNSQTGDITLKGLFDWASKKYMYSGGLVKYLKYIKINIVLEDGSLKTLVFNIPSGANELLKTQLMKTKQN